MNLDTHIRIYLGWFVGQSIKEGRCTTFNQYLKSKITDKIFRTVSEKLNVNGNVCLVIGVLVENTSEDNKIIKKEF